MNFSIFNWLLAITASVGVVGLIALVVFAPPVAQIAFNIVTSVIGKLLQSRIGVAILVGVACLIAGELAGDYHGRSVADAQCKAAQERADAEAAARDKQQGILADKDARKRIAVLEAAARKSQTRINQYAKALAKKPACALGANDL